MPLAGLGCASVQDAELASALLDPDDSIDADPAPKAVRIVLGERRSEGETRLRDVVGRTCERCAKPHSL